MKNRYLLFPNGSYIDFELGEIHKGSVVEAIKERKPLCVLHELISANEHYKSKQELIQKYWDDISSETGIDCLKQSISRARKIMLMMDVSINPKIVLRSVNKNNYRIDLPKGFSITDHIDLKNGKEKSISKIEKKQPDRVESQVITDEREYHITASNTWNRVFSTDYSNPNGIKAWVRISCNNPSNVSRIDIRMLSNQDEVRWSEHDTFPAGGSRRYWCGADVYDLYIRIDQGEAIFVVRKE